jgi:hypothetical protein
MAHRVLFRLCGSRGILPDSCIITYSPDLANNTPVESGGFGVVYRDSAHGISIAAKVFKSSPSTALSDPQTTDRMALHSQSVNHVHGLGLLGNSREGPELFHTLMAAQTNSTTTNLGEPNLIRPLDLYMESGGYIDFVEVPQRSFRPSANHGRQYRSNDRVDFFYQGTLVGFPARNALNNSFANLMGRDSCFETDTMSISVRIEVRCVLLYYRILLTNFLITSGLVTVHTPSRYSQPRFYNQDALTFER